MNEILLVAAGAICAAGGWYVGGLRTAHRMSREHSREMLDLWMEHSDGLSELHERHAGQLANMASYGRLDGRKPAEVLDTAPPEDEVAIRQMEVNALTRYVREQSPGISEEKAREEAMRMLSVATGEGS